MKPTTIAATLLILFSLFALSNSISAASINIHKDRDSALRTLDRTEGKRLTDELLTHLKQQSATQSVDLLNRFSQRSDVSKIGLEYAFWRLAKQTPGQLDPAVLDYLINYHSEVRMSHPESAHSSLPVFNIRAAAAGAKQLQQRQQDLQIAENLDQQPEEFLQHYLETVAVSQTALRVAALQLSTRLQAQLLESSLQRLKNSHANAKHRAALTDLSADLAFNQAGTAPFSVIIESAEKHRLPELLNNIFTNLTDTESKPLLYQALNREPEIAAIAIHYLAEIAETDQTVYTDLLGWLGEPNLSAAAALALSNSKRTSVHADLIRITASPQPEAARYARLTLSLIADSMAEDQL